MNTPRLFIIVVLALATAISTTAIAEDPGGPRDSRKMPTSDRSLPDRFGSGSDPGHREEPAEPDPLPPTAPPPVDCEALTDAGERLNCKAEKMHGQVSRTVDSVTGAGTGLMTEHQKGLVRHARDRSGKERERTGAKGFKRLARKRDGVECYTEEYDDPTGTDPEDDGNDDGVCDEGELCEEVNTDAIGDNDSKCEEIRGGGKPVEEVCVEICNTDTVDANESNFDDAVGRNAEEMFDDSAALLGDLNDELAAHARWNPSPQLDPSSTDVCDGLLTGTRQFPYPVLQATQAAANAVKLANDACVDVSRQSSGGFNFAAACVPFAVDMNVLQLVQDAFELQDDSITGARVDKAGGCLQQLGLEAKKNNDTVDGIADELQQARVRIEARLDELILLLNTPPGQRPDYPLPTGGVR